MPAKKSGKGRKLGRNKADAPAQKIRSDRNKARRLFKQELLAGRELPWPGVAENVLGLLAGMRLKLKNRMI